VGDGGGGAGAEEGIEHEVAGFGRNQQYSLHEPLWLSASEKRSPNSFSTSFLAS
jgi:hypothetical protein